MRSGFLTYAAIALLAAAVAVAGGIAAVWLGTHLGAPVILTVVLLLLVGELIASTRLNQSWPVRVALAGVVSLLQIPTVFGGATMFATAFFGSTVSPLPAWLDNTQMKLMQVLTLGLWSVLIHYLVWRFLQAKAPA